VARFGISRAVPGKSGWAKALFAQIVGALPLCSTQIWVSKELTIGGHPNDLPAGYKKATLDKTMAGRKA